MLKFLSVLIISSTCLVATSSSASSATHPLVTTTIMAKVLRVHNCEEPSWFVNAGQYKGGLGWLDATWLTYRLPGFPRYAFQATIQQQARAMVHFVTVAEHGWWPDQLVCHGY